MTKRGHEEPLLGKQSEPNLFNQGIPTPEVEDDSGVSIEQAARIAEDMVSAPEGLRVPSDTTKGRPSGHQARVMDSLDSQMSAPQAARAAGVEDYRPSSPPDAMRLPEKGRAIVSNRSKLPPKLKAAADLLPSQADLDARESIGEPLTEDEKTQGRDQIKRMTDTLTRESLSRETEPTDSEGP